MTIKKLKTYLPYMVALFAGLYFISFNITGRSFTHYPGDLGDGRFNNYLLEHAHQFFSGHLDGLWDAPFMYPETRVITYSDNLLGSTPFYSFFRILGSDRERAFQCWFILMSIFNYTACYLLLLFLFKSNYSAALGALIFAFSIALQSQVGHAQTLPRFAIPITIWLALLYLKDLRPRYFFGALFCAVYQLYCGIYLGLMLFVPLGLFFILSFYYKRGTYKLKIRDSRWRMAMIAALVINVFVLLPILLPYLERAKDTGFYPYKNIVESLPTITSFFYAHNGSVIWQFLNEMPVNFPAFWDHQIFPGGIAIITFFVFCWIMVFKMRSARYFPAAEVSTNTFILFFTGLLTFLFFIRVDQHSLYYFIYSLPGYGSLRALQRIINIELVFLAIATAFVLKLIFRKQRQLNPLIFAAFVVLFISDNYLRMDAVHNREVADNKKRVRYVMDQIGKVDKETIISYEPDSIETESIHYHLDAMLASQSLGLKTLNGYSATSPVGYSTYWIRANEESRKVWLQTKKLSDKHLLIIH